jgi:hypothetical protein
MVHDIGDDYLNKPTKTFAYRAGVSEKICGIGAEPKRCLNPVNVNTVRVGRGFRRDPLESRCIDAV